MDMIWIQTARVWRYRDTIGRLRIEQVVPKRCSSKLNNIKHFRR